jgi:hypothetical protein
MTDEFYSVAIPEQRQLLGLPLRPLSLGHLILLHRVQSAFVCDGITDYQELAVAALICSLTYEDGIEAIKDPSTPKLLKRLGERITGIRDWRVRIGIRKARVIDLPANVAAFSSYMREGSSIPHYSYTPGDFKSVDCPQVQIIKVTLMRDLHISESDLMDRSWAMCLWDYVTLRALKGEVSLVARDEINQAAEVGKNLMELIKSGKIMVR